MGGETFCSLHLMGHRCSQKGELENKSPPWPKTFLNLLGFLRKNLENPPP